MGRVPPLPQEPIMSDTPLTEVEYLMWDGRRLIVAVTDEDPGDIGEPRSVDEDNTTFLAVRALLTATEAAAGPRDDGLREARVAVLTLPYVETPGTREYRVEVATIKRVVRTLRALAATTGADE
jgi:hypothetical protein